MKIIEKGPVLKGIVNALSKSQSLLENFWFNQILPRVDKTSHFKVALAFGLMKLIIPLWKNKETLPTLLSPGLADMSLQLLAKLESADEAIILSALDSLIDGCKDEPKSQGQLLKVFLKVNTAFDKVTGSSCVQRMLANASIDIVKLASSLYKDALQGNKADGTTYSVQERVYAGHQLAKLVGHPATANDLEWKTEVICYLMTIILFELKQPLWPFKVIPLPLSRDARIELKETFFRALDVKVKSLESTCGILTKVVDHANSLLKKATLVQPMNAEASKAWKSMIEANAKVTSKEDRVFQLLLIHVGFQLFSSDYQTAIDLLNDLHVCYQKAKNQSHKKKGKKDDNEPNWVEVVTDLMLSLLSQNRNVLRQVVNSVTALLCPFMTDKALMTIMDVISPQEDEEMDVDSDIEDEEDDEFAPITEEDLKNLKQEEEDSDIEDEDSDGDEEESEEEEEEDENPEAELKTRLKAALGEDVDSEAESVDMDNLSDEAIEKLDTALAAVFKQLSGKKSAAEKRKEKKDALAQVHFKIRALDMIDSYLSHQPSMRNALFLSIPLIKALEKASKDKAHAPLETRLRGTLRKLTGIKKPEVDKNLEGEDLVRILEELVELANSGSPVVAQMSHPMPLFAQLGVLVVKCSQSLDDKTLEDKLKETFNNALIDFFHKPQCLLPMNFFQLPLQGAWQGILSIVPKLIENAFSKETRLFRRIQAITLLSTLFHNSNLKDSVSKKDLKSLVEQIKSLLQSYIDGDSNLKHKMLCELLHLIYGLYLTASDDSIVKWDQFKPLLEKLRAKVPKNRHFHEVKRAFNKISAPLKIQVVQGSDKKR